MKIIIKIIIALIILATGFLCFLYFAKYSEGVRAGELVKFTKKGLIIKTWEGQISQGVSESQFFEFSVEKSNQTVIDDLNNFQGEYVKLHYFERYRDLFWLGHTKYFVTKVEKIKRNEKINQTNE
ncbi:6-phosphogluconate dehydrogenase [Tamlana sp. 2_MG-2023]|uniref:6-phosphogluconate dehydrogenase n=1 Tax=unclassified Tamlana TaxID=2614803 RepID=UPI0026E2F66B|nr:MULTISPECIES: 6-phosphogluconate dehydrogenase [unclassified Tamlana]MDO6760056.1 6-phosphogluconate dehydrogenase [Tamlana sp. 2_MG-2023]MDO6790246.1 6-phosphogluconate dehydrogenase [Tamlana sp. 1_MG-2023]